MNSYGSVSLVSHAIYRVIRYMNWMNDDPPEVLTATATATATDAAADHNS